MASCGEVSDTAQEKHEHVESNDAVIAPEVAAPETTISEAVAEPEPALPVRARISPEAKPVSKKMGKPITKKDTNTIVEPKSNSELAIEKYPKLDLTLPEKKVVLDENYYFKKDEINEEYNGIPNLFEKRERRLAIGGSLILDPSDDDYMNALKGAEIKVELKTN
jgi:hypothetical protein